MARSRWLVKGLGKSVPSSLSVTVFVQFNLPWAAARFFSLEFLGGKKTRLSPHRIIYHGVSCHRLSFPLFRINTPPPVSIVFFQIPRSSSTLTRFSHSFPTHPNTLHSPCSTATKTLPSRSLSTLPTISMMLRYSSVSLFLHIEKLIPTTCQNLLSLG